MTRPQHIAVGGAIASEWWKRDLNRTIQRAALQQAGDAQVPRPSWTLAEARPSVVRQLAHIGKASLAILLI